jgi:hypothetical protein
MTSQLTLLPGDKTTDTISLRRSFLYINERVYRETLDRGPNRIERYWNDRAPT